MDKFKFLYRDQIVSQQLLANYIVGNAIHENGQIVASSFRGGMLTNTNTRYLFITNNGRDIPLLNDDYKKQGLYIFEEDLYYKIYDKYQVGGSTQILLSPDFERYDRRVEDLVTAARRDFNELLHRPPVGVLDTPWWRARLKSPIGKYGKKTPHSQISSL